MENMRKLGEWTETEQEQLLDEFRKSGLGRKSFLKQKFAGEVYEKNANVLVLRLRRLIEKGKCPGAFGEGMPRRGGGRKRRRGTQGRPEAFVDFKEYFVRLVLLLRSALVVVDACCLSEVYELARADFIRRGWLAPSVLDVRLWCRKVRGGGKKLQNGRSGDTLVFAR